MAVFGRGLRWSETANKDDDQIMLSVLDADGPAWLDAQVRAAARIAMINRDASDKIRRAMMRRAPTVHEELCTGTQVYFWSPHPMNGRSRHDVHRWRGPATVIARESQGRHYLGWKGRVLLTSKDQPRLATSLECAANETIANDTILTAGEQSEAKMYQDVAQISHLPGVRRTIQKIRKGWPKGKAGAKAKARPAILNEQTEQAGEDISRPASEKAEAKDDDTYLEQAIPQIIDTMMDSVAVQQQEQHPDHAAIREQDGDEILAMQDTGLEQTMELDETIEVAQIPVPESSDDDLIEGDQKKRQLLDDVPLSMKKPRLYEAKCVGINQVPELVIKAIHDSNDGDWLNRQELDGLSTLMNVYVTGARAHVNPRTRLFHHRRHENRNRLTVMVTHDAAVRILDQDTARNKTTSMPEQWRGMTIFYTNRPSDDDYHGTYFIDTPEGLIKTS